MKLSAVFFVIVAGLVSVQLVNSCGPLGPSHPFDLTNNNKTKELGYPSFLSIVKLGARRGIEECKKQFNMKRPRPWNCSFVDELVDPELPIFVNRTLPHATRETAFLHAISTAAITYELTLKCRHNIQGCKCSKNYKQWPRSSRSSGTNIGCGDNVRFGQTRTRCFFANREKGNDARTAMNLHNNKVGREVVQTSLVTWCKCHGIATACAMKTCYKILAPFEDIAAKLKRKYYGAVRVLFVRKRLQERVGDQFKIVSNKDNRLVYLDYCRRKTACRPLCGHALTTTTTTGAANLL